MDSTSMDTSPPSQPDTATPPMSMPLSQWLLQGLPPSQQQSPLSPAPLSDIIPTSSGLPHIPSLGPSQFDMCPVEWLATRQYCILAARATVGDLSRLSVDWKHYILQHSDLHTFTHHHHKALEALLH